MNIIAEKLRHITISVQNKCEATRFYENNFGMKLINKGSISESKKSSKESTQKDELIKAF